LFPKEGEKSLTGVYFKVTRGSHRLNGQNRYVIYANPEESTQINEIFEQRSNFYVNQTDKLYQEKQLVIKFK
jgi:NADH:ubiquinone oxidoreductase subunit